jgi:hypothetical protein
VFDNHEPRARRYALARRAIAIFRTLVDAGIVEIVRDPEGPSVIRLTVDLQPNFALNQPLSPFALAAISLLSPDPPGEGGVGTSLRPRRREHHRGDARRPARHPRSRSTRPAGRRSPR